MGRWYNTDTGRNGKFGFGIQSSTDPAEFGMREGDPNYITYFADEDDLETVVATIDKQYDILHIPKKDRIYRLSPDGEGDKEYYLLMEKYHDKNWHAKTDSDDGIGWAGPNNTTEYPNNDKIALAEYGLYLGLVIASDIQDEGFCKLEAEI